MTARAFKERFIEVIDFDDVSSGERVIEFRDPSVSGTDSLLAVVVPDGGGWAEARVGLNPWLPEVPAELLAWALSVARDMVG